MSAWRITRGPRREQVIVARSSMARHDRARPRLPPGLAAGRALGPLRPLRRARRGRDRARPRRRRGGREALRRALPRPRRRARAGELAAALDELEALQEPPGRAGAYASLRFAADTAVPAHGALLQRVQERGSAVRNALVFFQLEWVALDDAARRRARSPTPPSPAAATCSRRCAATGRTCCRSRRSASSRSSRTPASAPSGGSSTRSSPRPRFRVHEGGETKELSEEETLSLLYDAERERRRAGAAALTRGAEAALARPRLRLQHAAAEQGQRGPAARATRIRWPRVTSRTRSTPRASRRCSRPANAPSRSCSATTG